MDRHDPGLCSFPTSHVDGRQTRVQRQTPDLECQCFRNPESGATLEQEQESHP